MFTARPKVNKENVNIVKKSFSFELLMFSTGIKMSNEVLVQKITSTFISIIYPSMVEIREIFKK